MSGGIGCFLWDPSPEEVFGRSMINTFMGPAAGTIMRHRCVALLYFLFFMAAISGLNELLF